MKPQSLQWIWLEHCTKMAWPCAPMLPKSLKVYMLFTCFWFDTNAFNKLTLLTINSLEQNELKSRYLLQIHLIFRHYCLYESVGNTQHIKSGVNWLHISQLLLFDAACNLFRFVENTGDCPATAGVLNDSILCLLIKLKSVLLMTVASPVSPR